MTKRKQNNKLAPHCWADGYIRKYLWDQLIKQLTIDYAARVFDELQGNRAQDSLDLMAATTGTRRLFG